MNFLQLKQVLQSHQNKSVNFFIDKIQIPSHYHLTEVGVENRFFIDCGGTKRKSEKCVLQLWVANDEDHRLTSNKFSKILELANDLFLHDIPEVYIEYEQETVSQYPLKSFSTDDQQINFYLDKIHTQCLAPEKCGVSCCSNDSKELFNINIKNS